MKTLTYIAKLSRATQVNLAAFMRQQKRGLRPTLMALNAFLMGGTTMNDKQHTFGFDQAVRLLKRGVAVSRSGWNGKGMAIFLEEPDIRPLPVNVRPQGVEGQDVEWQGYIVMLTADGTLVPWLCSQDRPARRRLDGEEDSAGDNRRRQAAEVCGSAPVTSELYIAVMMSVICFAAYMAGLMLLMSLSPASHPPCRWSWAEWLLAVVLSLIVTAAFWLIELAGSIPAAAPC